MAERVNQRSPMSQAIREEVENVRLGRCRWTDGTGNVLQGRDLVRGIRDWHERNETTLRMQQRVYEINHGLRERPEGWDTMNEAERNWAADPEASRLRQMMQTVYSAKG